LRLLNPTIYELRNVNEELQQSIKQAEAANQAKSDFLNMISHELRILLMVVIGSLQELSNRDILEQETKDGIQEIVSDALEDAQHLLILINDVLDYSKIEAGKMEITPEPCNAQKIIHQAVASIQTLADKKGLSIDYTVPEELMVHAEAVRFKQILLNLLGNAVKFTHAGSITINAT